MAGVAAALVTVGSIIWWAASLDTKVDTIEGSVSELTRESRAIMGTTIELKTRVDILERQEKATTRTPPPDAPDEPRSAEADRNPPS